MKYFLKLLLVTIFLASCNPPIQQSGLLSWSYADLRLLQSPKGQDDSLQLVALYTRLVDSELQIRLDFLDFEAGEPMDIYLALNSSPGGKRDLPVNVQAGFDWDSLISIPDSGALQAVNAQGAQIRNLKFRVERDPAYDDIIISLDSSVLPHGLAGLGLQVFAARSGDRQIASSIGPVQADAAPPPQADTLLAFWESFPAVTPAQALRRWDGAHTGPFNGRHGLRHLLGATATYRTPIFLLDLKSTANLTALDTVGGLPVVQSLVDQGLVILPDVQPLSSGPSGSPFTLDSWAVSQALAETHQNASEFELPSSQALFSPVFIPSLIDNYSILFVQPKETGQPPAPGGTICACQRWQDQRVIPLPPTTGVLTPEEQQVDQNGLSLAVRRNLLKVGSQGGDKTGIFLLLGGNLAQSAWGDPAAARLAMDYIANHPWIHVMRMEDLLTCTPSGAFQTEELEPPAPQLLNVSNGSPDPPVMTLSQLQTQIANELSQAAPGPLTDAAWHAYRSLLTPGLPDIPELWRLRSGYLAPIGDLLAANRWSNTSTATDAVHMEHADVDWDGQEEILLISKSFFLIVEQDGGYVAMAIYQDQGGPHQIIGPSAQFYVGISDPTLWKPERGSAGDPEQMRGAFSEIPIGYTSPSWETFTASFQTGALTLQSPDGKVTKTIKVGSSDIHIVYQSAETVEVQVPLVLDPWMSNKPGWENLYESNMKFPNWIWGLKDGIKVEMSTSGELEPRAFSDSREALLSPEDPNYNYPPGHYLPFPMALGVIRGEGQLFITLTIHNK